MKPLLILRHLLHRLLLWQAEIEVHNAEVIAAEAHAEIDRAAQLLAHHTRRLNEARERAKMSGYAIDRAERIRFLGI